MQSDTKYFQPLKGTLKYFYLLFVIIYYTSRAKTQMFRNTTSKPPIGKMMTFPRSRRKAGIRKSNITLSVDINIRFEFMPPGSTVCSAEAEQCNVFSPDDWLALFSLSSPPPCHHGVVTLQSPVSSQTSASVSLLQINI